MGQRGGGLRVDRLTGALSPIRLPEFDSYCSVDVGTATTSPIAVAPTTARNCSAVQVGRRQPVLKKLLGETAGKDLPDSECPAPVGERALTRVHFETEPDHEFTDSVRGHAEDVANVNVMERTPPSNYWITITELAAQSPAIFPTGASNPAVFAVTCALVTSATEATTITLPASMYASTRSSRISQPRKTATTGLT